MCNKTDDYVSPVGTRYFIRGLDTEGNAANYVETEQIAQFESGVCSFVQVSLLLRCMYMYKRPSLFSDHLHVTPFESTLSQTLYCI